MYINRFFSFQYAFVSAAVNAPIVFYVNWGHGFGEALDAFVRQAGASFLITGFTAAFVIYCAKKYTETWKAYLFGCGGPALTMGVLAGMVHLYLGTPEVLLSALWPAFVTFCSSVLLLRLTRYGYTLKDAGKFIRAEYAFGLSVLDFLKRMLLSK